MMHERMFALLAMLAFLQIVPGIGNAESDTSLCGSPPTVVNEVLKADLVGKAFSLSKFFADASLTGKMEQSRTDVFSKYPDADRARSNAFFDYQVCVFLMLDTSLSSERRIAILRDLRIREPRIRISVSPIGPHINNIDIGLMNARTGKLRYYVDGELIKDNPLRDAFGTVELDLTEGQHSFKVEADVRGEKARVQNSCSAFFSVKGPLVLSPYVRFKNRGDGSGYIEECGLYPAASVQTRITEEHKCGLFRRGQWPDC